MTFLRDLPIDQYHAHEALSASKIKVFQQRGPLAFHQTFNTKTIEPEDKPCWDFGRAFDDQMFIDQAQWDLRYAIKPQGLNLSTKEGKAWKESIGGRTPISWDDAALMSSMHDAIARNTLAGNLLNDGEAQVSVRRQLPKYQCEIQCRPDWLNLTAEQKYLCDVKTCDRLERFEFDAVKFGYHSQMALAQWILAQEGHQCDAYLIVVEKQLAGRCCVFQIPEDVLADGWYLLKGAIAEICERRRTGIWYDDQTEPVMINVPGWQRQQLAKAVNDDG
jgi:hypothetical protein